MKLNHPDTCRKIDEQINDFEVDIRKELKGLVDEVVIETNKYGSKGIYKNSFIESYATAISKSFIDMAENVRQTNIDMRAAADNQIKQMRKN